MPMFAPHVYLPNTIGPVVFYRIDCILGESTLSDRGCTKGNILDEYLVYVDVILTNVFSTKIKFE